MDITRLMILQNKKYYRKSPTKRLARFQSWRFGMFIHVSNAVDVRLTRHWRHGHVVVDNIRVFLITNQVKFVGGVISDSNPHGPGSGWLLHDGFGVGPKTKNVSSNYFKQLQRSDPQPCFRILQNISEDKCIRSAFIRPGLQVRRVVRHPHFFTDSDAPTKPGNVIETNEGRTKSSSYCEVFLWTSAEI